MSPSLRWPKGEFDATPKDPLSPQERLLTLVRGSNEIEDELNGNKEFNDAWTRGVLHSDQSRAGPFATYPVDRTDRQISLLVDHDSSCLAAQRLR